MPKEIYSTSPDSSYKNFCHEKYKFDLEIHRSGVIWIFKNRDFSVQIIYKTHTHTHTPNKMSWRRGNFSGLACSGVI